MTAYDLPLIDLHCHLEGSIDPRLSYRLLHNAGHRQVPDANIALQHNLGLGGAAVVTMYKSN